VTVRALFHPIVEVEAGRRDSLIVVVIDPLPQERRDALGEGLAAALADVRAAVRDHGAMLEAMGVEIARLEAHPPVGVAAEVLAENLAFLRWVKDDHFVLDRKSTRLNSSH